MEIDGVLNTYLHCLSIINYIKEKIEIMTSVGDITNIYDDKAPRQKWLLGCIYDVITGKDGAVRGAKMFVGKTIKTVEHPLSKLYPVQYFNKFTIPAEDENIPQPPRGEAAILADIKMNFCN